MKSLVAALIFTCSLAYGQSFPGPDELYELEDLGLPTGTAFLEAGGINASLTAVATRVANSGVRVAFWDQDGSQGDLPVLAIGKDTRALDINDVGVVVGSAVASDNVEVPVSWSSLFATPIERTPDSLTIASGRLLSVNHQGLSLIHI